MVFDLFLGLIVSILIHFVYKIYNDIKQIRLELNKVTEDNKWNTELYSALNTKIDFNRSLFEDQLNYLKVKN